MFDIGWSEMLVIAVVMIVVVGPKELPQMLRTFGKTTAKLRAMAGDFQRQFNEALKEAELDDVKKSIDEIRGLNPASQIRKQLNPFEKAAADVRAGIDSALKPSTSSEPASPAVHAAEPAKAGPAAIPGSDVSPALPDAVPMASPEAVQVAHPAEPLKASATAALQADEAAPAKPARKPRAPRAASAVRQASEVAGEVAPAKRAPRKKKAESA